MALVKPLFMNPTEGFSEELSLTSGDRLNVAGITIPEAVSGGLGIDLGHNNIINVGTPVDPDDGVNKAYVDAIASGLDPHASVVCKTNYKLGSQARKIGSGGTWGSNLTTGDKFTVAIDGETPVLITLASAPVDRAAAITAINSLYAAGGGTGGVIAYAGLSGQIDIRSNIWGSASDVAITLADAVWGTEVGITNGTSTGANFVSGGGVGPTHSLESPINGGGYLNVIDGVTLAVGERVLVSMQGGNDTTGHVDNGVYTVTVLGGTSAKLKLVRAATEDQPTSTEMHKGLYVFVTQGTVWINSGWSEVLDVTTMETDPIKFSQFSGAPGYTYDQGLVLAGQSIQVDLDAAANAQGQGAPTASRISGLEFDVDNAAGKLRVAVAPNGGLQRKQGTPFGLEIKLNSSPNATLALDGAGAGLSVIGVPTQFYIGATQCSANVTAANLGTLTAGPTSDASSLHKHGASPATEAPKVVLYLDATGGTVAKGKPVYVSAADLIDTADTSPDSKSRVIGVASANPGVGNITPVVVSGIAIGLLTSASAGVPYYLQDGGGIGTGLPGAAKRVIQCGVAYNATDLFVRIMDYGKKAA